MSFRIIQGDALTVLRTLPDASVNCCITSPPYWGLRDYNLPPSIWGGDPACRHEWQDVSWKADRWGDHDDDKPGQKQQTNNGSLGHRGAVKEQHVCAQCGAWRGVFGLEPTLAVYVEHAVELFSQVRRVLRDDGTLWINMGDCFAAGGGKQVLQTKNASHGLEGMRQQTPGIASKQLIGMPWRVAFALQADGWWLRCDIIWHKVNPMPESVKDRPSITHEYIFLLAKSQTYYYDAAAIMEPSSDDTHARYSRTRPAGGWHQGSSPNESRAPRDRRAPGVNPKAVAKQDEVGNRRYTGFNERWRVKQNESFSAAVKDVVEMRNARSVWTLATYPFPEAHFATFPPRLIEPCVLAGCPVGGTILDPFCGAGTTGLVAKKHNRNFIGIELNPEYCQMAEKRCAQEVFDWQGADSESASAERTT